MNYNPDSHRNIHDAETARGIYMEKRKNDKKRQRSMIAVTAVVFILVVVCLIGMVRTFSGSHATYKSTVNGIFENCRNNSQYILSENELAIDNKWDKAGSYVTDKLNDLYISYCNGKSEYDETVNTLNAFIQLDSANDFCTEKLTNVNDIESGRKSFAQAKDKRIRGDFIGALNGYLSVSPDDKAYYDEALKKAKEIEKESAEGITYTVNTYLCKYDIEGARNFIKSISEKLGDSEFISSEAKRIEDYYAEQNDLVKYEGPVEHLFTHCLIAFPELCYSSPSMTASLDEDCITPSEFKKILNALYEKDYILIDINMLINETEEGTQIGEVMIPRGKTPFVFSVDDVTYDSRKMHTGMVDKLIVGDDGRVCTYTKHQDGSELVSYENECFPIIDEFVRQHPDFTFKGARGTLCHTGFDGVFGYRTQNEPMEEVNSEEEKEAALKVAAALREEGWTFASHSYGHAQMAQCDLDYIKTDTDKWLAEVVPIVGETKIMVWPYGNFIREGAAHEYLYNAGFRLFCGVGVKPYVAKEPDGLGIFMDRKALDGYSLRNRREKYMYLFDTEEVWDPLRPKEVTW